MLVFPAHPKRPEQPRQPAHRRRSPTETNALAWLDAEQDNLLAALHHSMILNLHHHTFLLVDACRFLSSQGAPNSHLAVTSAGLRAAQLNGDRAAEAWVIIGGRMHSYPWGGGIRRAPN